MTELKSRGLGDVYIVCTDELIGFPQAIEAVFTQAQVQTRIVHLIRARLNYVRWKESEAMRNFELVFPSRREAAKAA